MVERAKAPSQIARPGKKTKPEQPNGPSDPYFLISAGLLGAVIEILAKLPYNEVKGIMPALASCQQVTTKATEV